MDTKIPAVFNWSGGKDSTLALHYVLAENKYDVRYLLTTVNEAYDRIAMHGVRAQLLEMQVTAIGLPLYQLKLPEMPDMETYEHAMLNHFGKLNQLGIVHAIFGDIFLEDLKLYRENQFAKFAMQTVFPLWKRDSLALVKEFIALGYKTIVVCAQSDLKDFCGRIIDEEFLRDLPNHIDPCGENGEFHTFVFDGPIFKQPIKFELGEKVYKTFPKAIQSAPEIGFWYIDLLPKSI